MTRNINYLVNPGGSTGSLLAQGAFVKRHFVSSESSITSRIVAANAKLS